MADGEDDLLALDIDADNYAAAAAVDQGTSSRADRTHLSEAAFAETKRTYVAKHDNGDLYKALPSALPAPPQDAGAPLPRLTAKHVNLVAAAAGELYLSARYAELLDVVAWVRRGFDVRRSAGGKGGEALGDVLARWEGRCRARMGEVRSDEREGPRSS